MKNFGFLVKLSPKGITIAFVDEFRLSGMGFYHFEQKEYLNPVIWKEQIAFVVGAASSRDHFISRLEAAPTEIF